MQVRLYKKTKMKRLAYVIAFRQTGVPPVRLVRLNGEAFGPALQEAIEAIDSAERARGVQPFP